MVLIYLLEGKSFEEGDPLFSSSFLDSLLQILSDPYEIPSFTKDSASVWVRDGRKFPGLDELI